MGWLSDLLLTLPGWSVLALVFLVPALEAAAFPGVLMPGQSTVLIGGALAHLGRAPLASVLVAAALGAVIGPSVGYLIGRRWGHRMTERLPRRLVRPADVARAEALVRKLSGPALVAARFVALLRTLVPALSGAAGVPYRRFLLWNAVGGVTWAVGTTLAGFQLGGSWERLRSGATVAGWLAAAALALLALIGFAVHRFRLRRARPS
ncbi:DedA family protein [Streptomyces palmae]|uniref:DedA family protein n=1 Tax=Streptomyces palmae TaxID=1701085 RepID=A0A4Z0HBI7_9ACTN|nr:DedA family protein [Streptomyces palmae]TGB16546.1 DedA family protein [Streptomyces palmae]